PTSAAGAPAPATAPTPGDEPPAGPSADEIRASILAAMERDDAPPSPFGAATPTTTASSRAAAARPAPRRSSPQLSRLMGLDEADAPLATRQPTLATSVEAMGRRFMLSEREIEVLTLYALGYTQKRVAEELFISPGTAHTHIKRIYAKTGMHSRQDILDYLESYDA
ncbi:helix-turn-helix transcriptional regulator, partial [Enterorhabdus sp. P55]|uniref:helix-turn-helix transcriptional regulator n=1 Tax=Enterorhabdus sp. P55 TaxID=2304571 RepID=UPI00136A43E8